MPTWLECQSDSDDDDATAAHKRQLKKRLKAAKQAAKAGTAAGTSPSGAASGTASGAASGAVGGVAAGGTPGWSSLRSAPPASAAGQRAPAVSLASRPAMASGRAARGRESPSTPLLTSTPRVLLHLSTARLCAPEAAPEASPSPPDGAAAAGHDEMAIEDAAEMSESGGVRCVATLRVAAAAPRSDISIDLGEALNELEGMEEALEDEMEGLVAMDVLGVRACNGRVTGV